MQVTTFPLQPGVVDERAAAVAQSGQPHARDQTFQQLADGDLAVQAFDVDDVLLSHVGSQDVEFCEVDHGVFSFWLIVVLATHPWSSR